MYILNTLRCISRCLQADPEGERTIGVVTKVDMVPRDLEDTDFLEKVRMERANDVKLKLGFIPVLNRSPKEVST
jgi:hypothetical protein